MDFVSFVTSNFESHDKSEEIYMPSIYLLNLNVTITYQYSRKHLCKFKWVLIIPWSLSHILLEYTQVSLEIFF